MCALSVVVKAAQAESEVRRRKRTQGARSQVEQFTLLWFQGKGSMSEVRACFQRSCPHRGQLFSACQKGRWDQQELTRSTRASNLVAPKDEALSIPSACNTNRSRRPGARRAAPSQGSGYSTARFTRLLDEDIVRYEWWWVVAWVMRGRWWVFVREKVWGTESLVFFCRPRWIASPTQPVCPCHSPSAAARRPAPCCGLWSRHDG